MLKIGGMTFDVAVQNMVRRNYDFLIGRQTAEALRKRFGVLGGNGKASMVVAGRNLVVGVPRYQEIPSSAVRVAMKEFWKPALRIGQLIERTPPEVARSFNQKEWNLSDGGVSSYRGLTGT